MGQCWETEQDIGRDDIERQTGDQVEDQATLLDRAEQVGRLSRKLSDIRLSSMQRGERDARYIGCLVDDWGTQEEILSSSVEFSWRSRTQN